MDRRIGGDYDLRIGTRVRVRPGTPVEKHSLIHGLAMTGEVVNVRADLPDRVRVRWDGDHHRETIAVEHIEPL